MKVYLLSLLGLLKIEIKDIFCQLFLKMYQLPLVQQVQHLEWTNLKKIKGCFIFKCS